MARTFFGPLFVLTLAAFTVVAFTVAASSPPNLDLTLEAQQQLSSERPYDAAVHNDLGNLLILDGQYEQAETAYRRAIELDPANALARFNLGILLQQQGRNKQAQAEFSSLLEIDDRHAKAHYQLGALFEARGQRRKALDHYARAFAFDPQLTFAKNNPHLLDNRLATEAILLADRYDGDSSASTPRLYDEPERIVDLMLREEEAMEAESMPEPRSEAQARSPRSRHLGAAGRTGEAGRTALGEDEEDDAEDEEDDEEDRRALTHQDLDVGSSLGQARRGPNRRRPAIGVTERGGRTRRDNSGRGAAGRNSAVRERANARERSSATRQGATGQGTTRPSTARQRPTSTSASGRGGSSGRRYRPGTGSTGRLELKLLPPSVLPSNVLPPDLAPEPTERLAQLDSGSLGG
ncbi:MAG: tetratricopeptide repeat protein [Acidobacteriota bacterium]